MRHSHSVLPWAALMAVCLAACGGDSGPSTLTIVKAPQSGDLQTGAAGEALPDPLRVLVTRDGQALAGATVTWSTTPSSATVDPPSVLTGGDGIASTSWTLGPAVGTQSASAAVQGAQGSPVTFTAVATPVGGGSGASVTVSDNAFTPGDVTIDAGETVTWTWGSGAGSHSVQSTGSPSFPSSVILSGSGATYSHTFVTPGTYAYDCVVHGVAMSGTVTVQ